MIKTDKEKILDLLNNKFADITIVYDDGYNRHIQFKRKDSEMLGLEIVTWKGHLHIFGWDFASYSFKRTPDMFQFFVYNKELSLANDDMKINSFYWDEKCYSQDTQHPIKVFDADYARERLLEEVENYFEGSEFYEFMEEDRLSAKRELISAIDEEIDYENGTASCYNSIYSFISNSELGNKSFKFEFELEDLDLESYNKYYEYALYAIVWGIKKYFLFKKDNSNDKPKS